MKTFKSAVVPLNSNSKMYFLRKIPWVISDMFSCFQQQWCDGMKEGQRR